MSETVRQRVGTDADAVLRFHLAYRWGSVPLEPLRIRRHRLGTTFKLLQWLALCTWMRVSPRVGILEARLIPQGGPSAVLPERSQHLLFSSELLYPLCCRVCLLTIASLVVLWYPDFSPQRWQFFLVYIGFLLISLGLNVFFTRALHLINRVAFFWSIFAVLVCLAVALALSRKSYQPASFVFTTFINLSSSCNTPVASVRLISQETGWNDSSHTPWFPYRLALDSLLVSQSPARKTSVDNQSTQLATLSVQFALVFEIAAYNEVEEMPHPRRDAPRIKISAIGIGIVTTFLFVMALLFCITDLHSVISAPTEPMVTIFHQASGSRIGGTLLTLLPLVTIVFSGQGKAISGTAR